MIRGTIKAYSSCVNAGVIECDDGKTYILAIDEWQNNKPPSPREKVTFPPQNRAAKLVTPQT